MPLSLLTANSSSMDLGRIYGPLMAMNSGVFCGSGFACLAIRIMMTRPIRIMILRGLARSMWSRKMNPLLYRIISIVRGQYDGVHLDGRDDGG